MAQFMRGYEEFADTCEKCKNKLEMTDIQVPKTFSCGHRVCIDCYNKMLIGEAGDSTAINVACPTCVCEQPITDANSLANILSTFSLTSAPLPYMTCAACVGMDGTSAFYYTRSYKLMEFYQNETFAKLNITVALNNSMPYCDRCMLKEPIALQFYYQNANLIGVRIYEEIVNNLKRLFPEELDCKYALASIERGTEGMQKLMKYSNSLRDQSFRVYRLVLNTRAQKDSDYARSAMNEFIRLESCTEKLSDTYSFISDIIERNFCKVADLQTIINNQAMSLAHCIWKIHENYLVEFEHYVDIFSKKIYSKLTVFDTQGFKENIPDSFERFGEPVHSPSYYNYNVIDANSPRIFSRNSNKGENRVLRRKDNVFMPHNGKHKENNNGTASQGGNKRRVPENTMGRRGYFKKNLM